MYELSIMFCLILMLCSSGLTARGQTFMCYFLIHLFLWYRGYIFLQYTNFWAINKYEICRDSVITVGSFLNNLNLIT